MIICIDDFERKGKGISATEILGMVSLLKEQKKCKIVLILNEDEEATDAFEKYREKVIDYEIEFNPTAKECAEIAIEGDGFAARKIREFTEQLCIRNIRVLKKIKDSLVKYSPCSKDLMKVFYNKQSKGRGFYIALLDSHGIFMGWSVFIKNLFYLLNLFHVTNFYD